MIDLAMREQVITNHLSFLVYNPLIRTIASAPTRFRCVAATPSPYFDPWNPGPPGPWISVPAGDDNSVMWSEGYGDDSTLQTMELEFEDPGVIELCCFVGWVIQE